MDVRHWFLRHPKSPANSRKYRGKRTVNLVQMCVCVSLQAGHWAAYTSALAGLRQSVQHHYAKTLSVALLKTGEIIRSTETPLTFLKKEAANIRKRDLPHINALPGFYEPPNGSTQTRKCSITNRKWQFTSWKRILAKHEYEPCAPSANFDPDFWIKSLQNAFLSWLSLGADIRKSISLSTFNSTILIWYLRLRGISNVQQCELQKLFGIFSSALLWLPSKAWTWN